MRISRSLEEEGQHGVGEIVVVDHAGVHEVFDGVRGQGPDWPCRVCLGRLEDATGGAKKQRWQNQMKEPRNCAKKLRGCRDAQKAFV